MDTHRFAIQTFEGLGVEPVAAFIAQYRQTFPDAKLMPPELYVYHPLLEEGKNVFGAFDDQQRLVGFAPVFPAPVMEESAPDDPHHIWTIIVALPDAPDADDVRDGLFRRVVERANAIRATFTPRATRLASDLMASQPDIRYLLARGFAQFDGLYVLRRALADPVPATAVPDALTVRRWKMPTEAEQRDYLEAFDRCFLGNPKTWESWQFFLQSALWGAGSAVAAFDRQNRLVGSILVYWDEAHQYGVTDDVFVLPEWRGRGIAKCLIAKGLRYLRDQGAAQVVLEVRRENIPALSVYQAMGYEKVNEEVMLGLWL